MSLPRHQINFLTFNIFMRPPPIKNMRDDYKSERLEDIALRLKDFDIACFQESFSLASTRKHALISYG